MINSSLGLICFKTNFFYNKFWTRICDLEIFGSRASFMDGKCLKDHPVTFNRNLVVSEY